MHPTSLLIEPDTTSRHIIERFSPRQHLMAAMAEAWHVDGMYLHAAVTWERLHEEHPSMLLALKTASAWSSIGNHAIAETWLSHARNRYVGDDPTLDEDLHYTTGLAKWAAADPPASIEALRYASAVDLRRARSLNFLGVIAARQGDRSAAVRHWADAIRRESDHYDALINLALAAGGGSSRSLAAVRSAVVKAIHRSEAFALLERWFQETGDEQSVTTARQKVQLRRRWLGAIPLLLPSIQMQSAAHVSGSIQPGDAMLEVVFKEIPSSTTSLDVLVSPAWRLTIESLTIEPVERGCTGWNLHRYRLPVDLNGCTPVVQLAGSLFGTGVHVASDRIECDGRSGWLPRPDAPIKWGWSVKIDVPTSLIPRTSASLGPTDTPSLLALPRGSWIIPSSGSSRPDAVYELTAVQTHARLLCLWAAQATALWSEILGDHDLPIIGVVDVTGIFNYTRSSYIRTTASLLHRPDQHPQICHEVGHIWWGTDAQFASEDEWLGEALAEFTMHLIQDRGLLPDYRSAALSACSGPALLDLARLGLRELAGRHGRLSAYVLRVKGGYMIAMLAEIIGATAFRLLLRLTFRIARTCPIRSYDFFALASWIHGHSLVWFANQWVNSNHMPMLTASVQNHTGSTVQLSIHSDSAATFGVPVEIRAVGPTGESLILEVPLDTGRTDVIVDTPWMPRTITLDPQHRLWALTGGDIAL